MKKAGGFLKLLFGNWWFRHIIFWFVMINYMAWGIGFSKFPPGQVYWKSISLITGSLIVVYPLLYILIPRLLVKRKFLLFVSGYIILLYCAGIVTGYIDGQTGSSLAYKAFNSNWGNVVLPYVNLSGIAASLKIIRFAFFQETKAQDAINEQSLAELELLKAQIHPHFLFNTLSNLYTHTKHNSSESSQIVLTLSDLLRFMIYESRADFIPLKEEIQLIKNYVELEKYRYDDDLDISLTFSGEIEGKLIRPLLLLPLLENCFKHGMGEHLEQKWISLDLNVDQSTMHFKLANSRDGDKTQQGSSGSGKGISLENVKRRLEILYPGEYTLMIKEEMDLFLIKLELKLKKEPKQKTVLSNTETKLHDLEMPAGG